jgi:hypothetical protein
MWMPVDNVAFRPIRSHLKALGFMACSLWKALGPLAGIKDCRDSCDGVNCRYKNLMMLH